MSELLEKLMEKELKKDGGKDRIDVSEKKYEVGFENTEED